MNDQTEIHFDCPKCRRPMRGDRALLGEMIACPDCNEPFIPKPRKAVVLADDAPAIPRISGPDEVAARALSARQAQKIEANANAFARIAGISAVVGTAAAALGILGQSAGPGYFAAGFFGLALWLYLIAQIIHIRALMTRK